MSLEPEDGHWPASSFLIVKEIQNTAQDGLFGDDMINARPVLQRTREWQLCAIGPFLLDRRGELLLHDSEPMPLGRRAVALLIRLVESRGEIVSHDELLEAGWHGLIVEDSNLPTQMSQLRRVLAQAPGGKEWIETMPKRGYRFTGPLELLTNNPPATARPSPVLMPSHPSGPPALAVMPFQVRNPQLDDFAEGLAEDIVSMLASLRELVVISRTSTLAAQQRCADMMQAGRELGAGYVLSGAVRSSASGTRVIVELADCITGTASWSHNFDVAEGEAPRASVPVVALIVNTLVPKLREQELRRLHHVPVTDFSDHQLLLQARLLMTSLKQTAVAEAQVLVGRVIAHDPGCAPAFAMAADLCSIRLAQRWSEDRLRDRADLEEHARKAIALDSSNTAALARLGHARAFYHRDFEGARVFLDRALDSGPSHLTAWKLSSVVLAWMGDGAAAIRHAERALQLAPLDPLIYQVHMIMAVAYYTLDDHEAAITWVNRSQSGLPRPGTDRLYAVASLVALDRVDEAKALMCAVLADHPNLSVSSIRETHPYREEARRNLYADRLLAAGCNP